MILTAAQRRRQQVRAVIDEAKNVPCIDCGERYHPVAMDLDHRDGVRKGPSRRQSFANWAGSVSLRRLRAELKKCDVRCANCHRVKTLVTEDTA